MPHGKPSARAMIWTAYTTRQKRDMRRALVSRDGSRCFHCGVQTTKAYPGGERHLPTERTIDHHPIPKRDLPEEEWLNPDRAVIACLRCNQRINRKTQLEAK